MAKSEHNYRGLKHRTRGDANPQGRPRVYFCCHPDDFGRLFGPVVDEILGVQTNAAIWYYDPAEGIPDGPEFLEDLRRMQLFVIPVTSRFVYRESRAREVELPLAIEAHVPVLPIMQEDIPNRDFSQACGSLQTLNRYTSMSDPTAIPYEERLRRFLQSVLVGDELAERVRAAFDAYVFLSYRKKDRAQAQRVMRLIHEDELCRDLAIWYDEFLVPGEDFHDAISDALRRCSVFSLVVTPHLLEPGNFVMREEYPAARDSGKPVVPVEAVETDRGELADAYGGIGDAVPADDRDGLSSRLLDSLREVALRENDQDPQHNFFIGLAYLTGIDVEVNHERALALITSAAEAGLPEAYERLVAMYNTGEGVGRDYHKAIEWQERYVGTLRIDESNTQEMETRLFYALCDLGDLLLDMRDYSRASETYSEMRKLYAESSLHIDDRDSDRLSTALTREGYARQEIGDHNGAIALFTQALAHCESVAEATKSVLDRRNAAATLIYLADAYREADDLEAAGDCIGRAVKACRDLAFETGEIDHRVGLAIALTSAGDNRRAQHDLAGSIEFYKQAIEVREAIVSETDSANDRHGLATELSRVGLCSLEMGDADGAAAFWQRSISLSEELVVARESLEDLRSLQADFVNLGEARRITGNHSEACSLLEQAVSICEQIVAETCSEDDRAELAECLLRLGSSRMSAGDANGAIESYEKAVKIQESIPVEKGCPLGTRWLAAGLLEAGNTARSGGNLHDADMYYERAIAILESLSAETEDVNEWRRLAYALSLRGVTLQSSGMPDTALTLHKQAIEICEKLVRLDNTITDVRNLAVSQLYAGDVSLSLDDQSHAASYYERALILLERVVGFGDSPKAREELAIAHQKLGLLTSLAPAERITHLEELIAISSRLFDETGLERYRDWIDDAQDVIGRL